MNLPARRGIALTAIGPILMLIFAPAALGIGVWRGVVASDARLDAYPWVRGAQSIRVDDTAARSILVSDDTMEDISWVDCVVSGPSGEADLDVGVDGGPIASSYVEFGVFHPDTPGSYELDCATEQVKVVPTTAVDDADEAFGLRFLVGLVAAVVLFLIGGTLLIVGIVKLVRSSQERQRALLARAGYGYGPYQRPYQGPTYGVPPLAPYQNGRREQLPAMRDPKDPFAPPTERTP